VLGPAFVKALRDLPNGAGASDAAGVGDPAGASDSGDADVSPYRDG
jgi:hypothetical protein